MEPLDCVHARAMKKKDMSNPPALAVVIPFYNERDNVAPLLAEVDDALASIMHYELIAVDDGSTDGAAEALVALGHDLKTLRVLRLPGNRGQSAALVNGIHAARAPLIATLDGDGQNPPADIATLVSRYRKAVAAGPVAIAGWRQHRNDTPLRRLSSRLANGFRSAVLGDRCPDTGCGLKVFARDDFLALPRFCHMHRFLPALFVRAGVRVTSVPVAHRTRRTGRSKYGIHNRLWTGLLDLAGVCWLMRRDCRIEYEADDV